VAVVNDAVGALRASVPEGPGVVVVCGTGATTAARGVDGRVWHSSFWQEPQGAQELGVRALQAVLRAELGIHPPTSLTPRLLGATGEPSVEALLHRMTSRERRVRFGHAAFAPLLLDAAEAGDPSAVEIVTEHGQALGRMALAAARRVGIEQVPFTLALTGGVFRHRGTIHRDAVLSEVASRAPGTTVIDAALEPAVGALLLAFDRAAIEVGDAVLGRLRATLPPSGLFATLPTGGVAQG
jgi:N-acetylglucosamine kinase-like BadF-type ATPase